MLVVDFDKNIIKLIIFYASGVEALRMGALIHGSGIVFNFIFSIMLET